MGSFFKGFLVSNRRCRGRHRGQSECVVEFAMCQQSGIGRDHGAAKLQHQAAVEIERESPLV